MQSSKHPLPVSMVGRTILVKKYQGEDNPERLSGIVLEDTKHTIVVKTNNTTKRLIKEHITFAFEDEPGKTIEGNSMNGKVHERIKQLKVNKQ